MTADVAVRTFAEQPHDILVVLARAFGVDSAGDSDQLARRLVAAGAVPGESFR